MAEIEVTDEKLRDMQSWFSGGFEPDSEGMCEYWLDKADCDELVAALRELQRRRASPQWVEWRHGDQIPPDGIYWATIRYTTDEGNPNTVPRVQEIQSGWGEWQTYSEVLAYWSMPRPSPYTPDTKGQA